ncbi:MAG: substrate-binding domain-containing protein [Desulfobacterales bacterium]|nr:substrate-binding domain-containing protein [Desulfobacterales bacterium]
MGKILKSALFCIILLLINGMSLAKEKIVIEGTGDSHKLLQILARAFENANPDKKIEIPESIGSSGGIKATAEGKCELGRVARPIRDKEKGYKLNYKVFAYSPVVFVANRSVTWNNNLTKKQILDIYSGKITLWSDLGGKKDDIYIANREEGDSSREVLTKNFHGWKEIENFAGKIIYSTPETIDIISNYKNTIGYVPLSETKGTDLVIMKIDEIYPSAENVKNGKYNLIAPFGIVWKGEMRGLSKAFFDFIFTPEAQKIIIENGCIPAS